MKLHQHVNRLVSLVCLLGALTVAKGATATAAADKSAELVKQGNDFRSKGKLTEALWAYRQAAKSGDVNGAAAAGDMLFHAGQSETGHDRILNLHAGLGYLFVAATNRQPQACVEISEAFQNGLGVRTNLVSAYAWLLVAAENNNSFKPELDRLVIQLEPREVIQAQREARAYLSGHWPVRVARPIQQGDPRLEIQGLSQGPNGTLVILNGNTFAAGESANVFPAGKSTHDPRERLTVSCREIGPDYMLVAVAGETSLKMLSIANH